MECWPLGVASPAAAAEAIEPPSPDAAAPYFLGGKHYMAYCMGDMPQLDSDEMRSMLDQGAHVMSS